MDRRAIFCDAAQFRNGFSSTFGFGIRSSVSAGRRHTREHEAKEKKKSNSILILIPSVSSLSPNIEINKWCETKENKRKITTNRCSLITQRILCRGTRARQTNNVQTERKHVDINADFLFSALQLSVTFVCAKHETLGSIYFNYSMPTSSFDSVRKQAHNVQTTASSLLVAVAAAIQLEFKSSARCRHISQ